MRTRSMAVALAMLLATQAALAATRPPAPAKAGIRPVVFADQVARVTVGRGTALLDTTIDYTVRQGQLRDLALALPAEATVRLVQGDGLRTWAVTTEDGQRVLRVLLAEPAAGRYQLWLRVEQAFPRGAIGQPVALTLPAVAPLDVERETGVVAVLTRTGVEVEAGQMKGAATLKPAELPAAFAEIKDKVRLAYRLVKRPCVVEVQATEVEAETLLTGPVTLEAPRLLLNEATGTGAVGDTVAKVTLNVAFEAVGRGTSEALLLPPDVALTDYRFTGGRGAKIIRDATGYLLRAAAAGEGSVEVQYVVVVEKKEKIRSLALPLVPAAKASTGLRP